MCPRVAEGRPNKNHSFLGHTQLPHSPPPHTPLPLFFLIACLSFIAARKHKRLSRGTRGAAGCGESGPPDTHHSGARRHVIRVRRACLFPIRAGLLHRCKPGGSEEPAGETRAALRCEICRSPLQYNLDCVKLASLLSLSLSMQFLLWFSSHVFSFQIFALLTGPRRPSLSSALISLKVTAFAQDFRFPASSDLSRFWLR